MKSWIAILPLTALIVGGSVACERKDYNESKTETGAASSDANSPIARTQPGLNEPGMARPAPAAPGQFGSQASPGGGQEEAAGTEQKTLTGKLNVQDEDARTFVIEGSAQTYVAPQQADLDQLDGEQVIVRLDENGRVQTIEIAGDRAS